MASEAIESDISGTVVLLKQLQVQTKTTGTRRYNLCACFREHYYGPYSSVAHPAARLKTECFLCIVDLTQPPDPGRLFGESSLILKGTHCSGQWELEFPGLSHVGGLGSPTKFVNEIGTLLPMALCGLTSL